MKSYTHKDCKYYLAVDVFKGLCKKDNTNLSADDPACEKFTQLAQCKHCIHFTQKEPYLGTCMGTTDAYPDMTATTCKEFQWRQKQ